MVGDWGRVCYELHDHAGLTLFFGDNEVFKIVPLTS